MSAPAPGAVEPTVELDAPRPRRAPRAWFRARLERDPRRWVLLLAALEGLATFTLNFQAKREVYEKGVGVAVLLGFAVLAPLTGVLTMIAHGRLLLWTGKLLRGRAAGHEIHAAFAWAQAPLVAAAAPLVLEIPLRLAAAEAERVPPSLSAALRGLDGAADVLLAIALVAASAGVFLYVKFLAEAQRFSSWRAIVNHLLAGLLGVALLFAGVFAAGRLMPGAPPVKLGTVGLVISAAAALLVERLVVRRRARVRAAGS